WRPTACLLTLAASPSLPAKAANSGCGWSRRRMRRSTSVSPASSSTIPPNLALPFLPRLLQLLAQQLCAVQNPRSLALDEVGRHEVKVVLPHRRQLRPAAPVVQPSRRLWPLLAGDDDLGVGHQHRFQIYLRRQTRQTGEDVLAATQLDDLADHLPPTDGHQRRVPDLVEHPQPRPAGMACG